MTSVLDPGPNDRFKRHNELLVVPQRLIERAKNNMALVGVRHRLCSEMRGYHSVPWVMDL